MVNQAEINSKLEDTLNKLLVLFVVLGMEKHQKSFARGPVRAIRTLKYQDVVKSLQIL